ncbi:MAG: formylmethanofuran dehydrogenase subunit A [Pirellulales bacterium]
MTLLKIAGGAVHDPANGSDGDVCDLWIRDGRLVAPPSDKTDKPSRIIDAAGYIVMPGGIDMHCHIAGPKVNAARKMRPEEKRSGEHIERTPLLRSGTLGSVPSTFATGYKYAGMGYTTAFDAAVSPLTARHVHEEFSDTPCLDKGFYALLGNNHFVMDAIRRNDADRLREFVSWLVRAAKAYGVKIVNPGGVENWKQRHGGNVDDLDATVDGFGITPRDILQGLAGAVDALKLPHSVHVHCNNLGLPGNWTTTLETMRALEGRRAHLTHIQFHSYGGGEADEGTFRSQVAPLAEYVNTHANVTVDVGQVMFGRTTSMTGDGPLGYYLQKLNGGKWYSCDTELESGCGVSPIEYKNKRLVHALQWAIGLDWYLMVDDPWRVVMSTDHPNGGSFLAYPQIIRLLMDRAYRQEQLAECPRQVRERSHFGDIEREYSLNEIAIITRAGPARILGLANKGHLGAGADADVTIYAPHENKEIMFSLPRYVIKAGEIVIDDTEFRATPSGGTLYSMPRFDEERESEIHQWFDDQYSVSFENYPVAAEEIVDPKPVTCE